MMSNKLGKNSPDKKNLSTRAYVVHYFKCATYAERYLRNLFKIASLQYYKNIINHARIYDITFHTPNFI